MGDFHTYKFIQQYSLQNTKGQSCPTKFYTTASYFHPPDAHAAMCAETEYLQP